MTSSDTNLMEIIVHFDERMNIDDLREAFNFFIVEQGGPPVTAVEGADGKSAILTLVVPLEGGTSYSVRVDNARDLAGNAMNSTTLTFTAGGRWRQAWLSPCLVETWSSRGPRRRRGSCWRRTPASLAATWATVTGAPTVVAGRNTLTLTRTGTTRFFRLRQ